MRLRFSLSLVVLAATAVQASVLQDSLNHIALLERQAPGTPQFECHSNCGNALAGGRIEGHCNDATWTGYYEACLKCALQFDIWRLYGTGVTAAAAPCGLTPTPSPSGAGSGSAVSTGPSASGTASATVSRTGAATIPTPPPSGTGASGSGSTAATITTSTAGAPAQGAALLSLGPLLAGFLGVLALV